ncbi:magnesium transporter [Aminobacter aminovorans]|uniref:Magnesium transporter MgtE n=1 Tax=Aminobacter aminovorans TaxID=83263 RepID=A0AAC9FD90_AMIAI|nr:magnesium transporter [Aminobacter aminovorans]AMS40712.1 Magnesium transporter [Aminobacter aminovorans]MBB3706347.1 magnesium transporter [Aminobacter aminovorans]
MSYTTIIEELRDDAVIRDNAAIASRLAEETAPDVVEVLNTCDIGQTAQLLELMPVERAVEVLDQPAFDHAAELLSILPGHTAARLLAGMSADRAADALREIDPGVRAELLTGLDGETRAALERLLAYPEGCVGAMMTTEFVSVPSNWTVAEVLRHVRAVENTRETVYAVFVVDPLRQTLVHAVPLRRVISADPRASILSAVPKRRLIKTSALAPREEAVRLIAKYDLLAVPVVDSRNHLIGIVTVDDVIDTMVKRDTEQVHRMGGMEALDEHYMDIGFLRMIRKRAGWLSVLFLSEMLTASAMQSFEGELEKAIVLTLFIPLIMSSGGNSGSQASSLLIRALALHEVRLGDWWKVALRELPAGLTLGSILGVIGMVRIVTWQMLGFYDYGPHWQLVALTIGATLVGIVTFGSMTGSMLPFVLKRLGFDPATASAPFVATLVDVTGLVIYFSIALVILHGTLL